MATWEAARSKMGMTATNGRRGGSRGGSTPSEVSKFICSRIKKRREPRVTVVTLKLSRLYIFFPVLLLANGNRTPAMASQGASLQNYNNELVKCARPCRHTTHYSVPVFIS